MNVLPFERIAIFIDGWNFKYATYDSFSLQVDYTKFLEYLSQRAILIRAYYYIGEWAPESIDQYVRLLNPPDPDAKRRELEEQSRQQRGFWRFLNRNGYMVVRKPIRVFFDRGGSVAVKADLDLELAIDMLTLADKCEKQILVSGDGDFVPLVRAVAAKGVRVVVVSTQHPDAMGTAHYRASDELLDAADEFIPIESISRLIQRVHPTGGTVG